MVGEKIDWTLEFSNKMLIFSQVKYCLKIQDTEKCGQVQENPVGYLFFDSEGKIYL